MKNFTTLLDSTNKANSIEFPVPTVTRWGGDFNQCDSKGHKIEVGWSMDNGLVVTCDSCRGAGLEYELFAIHIPIDPD